MSQPRLSSFYPRAATPNVREAEAKINSASSSPRRA
jgi:hypothetical protein